MTPWWLPRSEISSSFFFDTFLMGMLRFFALRWISRTMLSPWLRLSAMRMYFRGTWVRSASITGRLPSMKSAMDSLSLVGAAALRRAVRRHPDGRSGAFRSFAAVYHAPGPAPAPTPPTAPKRHGSAPLHHAGAEEALPTARRALPTASQPGPAHLTAKPQYPRSSQLTSVMEN